MPELLVGSSVQVICQWQELGAALPFPRELESGAGAAVGPRRPDEGCESPNQHTYV